MTIHALVFTDLDGSLLDHHSYDHSPALSALERLAKLGAALIPTTSKTLAEIEALAIDFGNAPRIAENGMAVHCPEGCFEHFSGIYCESADIKILAAALDDLPEDLRAHITGMHEMSIKDVVRHTGLPERSAVLAKERNASIPFIWTGNDAEMKNLCALIAGKCFRVTRGGRFYHLMGQGSKGAALGWVCEQYKKQSPDAHYVSIALGDGANDAEMIAAADYGVKIPNPDGYDFEIHDARGTIIHAPKPGPAGWSAAIHSILDELNLRG